MAQIDSSSADLLRRPPVFREVCGFWSLRRRIAADRKSAVCATRFSSQPRACTGCSFLYSLTAQESKQVLKFSFRQ